MMKRKWNKPVVLALGVDSTREDIMPYQFLPEKDYAGMSATCRRCNLTFSSVAEYNAHVKINHNNEENGYVHS